MLLPDEVLSMIFVRAGKAAFKKLHLVCSRIRWQMIWRRVAATGTAGLVIAALEKMRRAVSSGHSGGTEYVKLECKADIQNGKQRCTMHLVQQCAAQRHYLEANLLRMLRDEQQHGQQRQQQQEQEQPGHQMADGTAARQAGASSADVAGEVRVARA
jgi:hypothetical protein